MSVLGDLLSTLFERGAGESLARIQKGNLPDLTRGLLSSSGEVSGMAYAQEILERYAKMDGAEKLAFFLHLDQDLDLDPARVRDTLDAYTANPDRDTYRAFMEAAEPPRQELIRRLNALPGATARLVAMRADLLALLKAHPELGPLDGDFRHLFSSWFNRGFLVLRSVNWDSPASLLDKIVAYEAVHAIDSWDDLRRRLHPADRRCFAFFHPAVPDEPLIFVEVALTRGVPGSIQAVLAEDRAPLKAAEADTAVFYSISNCQAGLAGISFGNSLIKQVVADLSAELPGLKTFVTLSPIPGLMKWLDAEGIPAPTGALRPLAARYLLEAKRGDGQPLDPVARFHLGNGASVHMVHEGADTSPRGLAQSGGAMVNYAYDLNRISKNHERFATAREIAASSEVTRLSQQGRAEALPERQKT
ncbi:malonyl-CoA decarboxylase [Oceaniglobus roseus]|uniref:malonyl-CoA decarboxylase n=1 Tax=Oceaniglobus roseus TaxID=1737570 RepID=UPI000C7E965E|nr:malonyl-CoA decarboxylase [Kandeliimicrobium roseum]